jgi:hypothetical protein
MLSAPAHEGKENIENGIINKHPVNSESKEQEQKEQEQVENIHNPTKTDSSPLNPILKLYQNNSESLNKLAMGRFLIKTIIKRRFT